jgi:ornithine cyclodeaminase/alanine dehydrogenase-like protein (mu-crystallin family)
MDIVVLSHDDVVALLPMGNCIDLMSDALEALAKGEVTNPLRSVLRPEGAGHFFGLMPAYRGGGDAAYAIKEVCIFPENPKRGLDAHQGAVLLHSAEDGQVLAVMNASAITAIRTAAVSGLATRLLARGDATELAIVGTGVQARAHLDSMAAARTFSRARIAGRTPAKAKDFVSGLSSKYAFRMEPAESAEEAIRGADVIVTATNSAEPVLRRTWVKPGAHINAVGSCSPKKREIDTETVAASKFFVDRRESALNEAGDYIIPASEGAVGPGHIRAEIGELLIGRSPGRTSPEEITIFESQGIAIEDLAAAQFLYRKALETGAGSRAAF